MSAPGPWRCRSEREDRDIPGPIAWSGREERIIRMSFSRRVAWAALTLALAVAIPGAAHAQYFGQNKVQYRRYEWRSLTSDHFEVYFYTGLDSLARRALDLAEKTNAMLSTRMGHRL